MTDHSPIRSISAVTLFVADINRSVAFYTSLRFDVVHGGLGSELTSLAAGDQFLNLMASPEKPVIDWGRLVVHVEDVDDQYRRAVEVGFAQKGFPATPSGVSALLPRRRPRRAPALLRPPISVADANAVGPCRRVGSGPLPHRRHERAANRSERGVLSRDIVDSAPSGVVCSLVAARAERRGGGLRCGRDELSGPYIPTGHRWSIGEP